MTTWCKTNLRYRLFSSTSIFLQLIISTCCWNFGLANNSGGILRGSNLDDPLIAGGQVVSDRVTRNYVARCTLVFTTSPGLTRICAGAIIAKNVIATSAHCTHFSTTEVLDPNAVSCTVGDLNVDTKETNEVTVQGTSVTRHPNYNPVTRQFDIAKIFLASNLTLNATSFINNIAVNSNWALPTNGTINVAISGWGNAQGGSPLLTTSVFKLRDPQECTATFANYYKKYTFDSANQICVTANAQNIGPCFGDDGAPSVTSVNGKDTLIGTISFYKEVVVTETTTIRRKGILKLFFPDQSSSVSTIKCDLNVPSVAVAINGNVATWLLS